MPKSQRGQHNGSARFDVFGVYFILLHWRQPWSVLVFHDTIQRAGSKMTSLNSSRCLQRTLDHMPDFEDMETTNMGDTLISPIVSIQAVLLVRSWCRTIRYRQVSRLRRTKVDKRLRDTSRFVSLCCRSPSPRGMSVSWQPPLGRSLNGSATHPMQNPAQSSSAHVEGITTTTE